MLKYSLYPEVKKFAYFISHRSRKYNNDSIIDKIYYYVKKYCIDLLKLPSDNKIKELIGPSTFINVNGIKIYYSQWFSSKYCNLPFTDLDNYLNKCNYLEKYYKETLLNSTILDCIRQLHFRVCHLRNNIQEIAPPDDKFYLKIIHLENIISNIKNKISTMEYKITIPLKPSSIFLNKRKFYSIESNNKQYPYRKFIKNSKNFNETTNNNNKNCFNIMLNQPEKYDNLVNLHNHKVHSNFISVQSEISNFKKPSSNVKYLNDTNFNDTIENLSNHIY